MASNCNDTRVRVRPRSGPQATLDQCKTLWHAALESQPLMQASITAVELCRSDLTSLVTALAHTETAWGVDCVFHTCRSVVDVAAAPNRPSAAFGLLTSQLGSLSRVLQRTSTSQPTASKISDPNLLLVHRVRGNLTARSAVLTVSCCTVSHFFSVTSVSLHAAQHMQWQYCSISSY